MSQLNQEIVKLTQIRSLVEQRVRSKTECHYINRPDKPPCGRAGGGCPALATALQSVRVWKL